VAGFCEHGNEPSSSIRKQDFSDNLSDNFSNNVLHRGVSRVWSQGIGWKLMKY
jgi:hypothetical protein